MQKYHIAGFLSLLALLPGFVFGQIGGITSVTSSISGFCAGVSGILPAAAMIGVFASAIVFAVGQASGAETRARANVWATALFSGAVIAILMQAVLPSALGAVYGSSFDCSGANTPPPSSLCTYTDCSGNPVSVTCCSSSQSWCPGSGGCRLKTLGCLVCH